MYILLPALRERRVVITLHSRQKHSTHSLLCWSFFSNETRVVAVLSHIQYCFNTSHSQSHDYSLLFWSIKMNNNNNNKIFNFCCGIPNAINDDDAVYMVFFFFLSFCMIFVMDLVNVVYLLIGCGSVLQFGDLTRARARAQKQATFFFFLSKQHFSNPFAYKKCVF